MGLTVTRLANAATAATPTPEQTQAAQELHAAIVAAAYAGPAEAEVKTVGVATHRRCGVMQSKTRPRGVGTKTVLVGLTHTWVIAASHSVH